MKLAALWSIGLIFLTFAHAGFKAPEAPKSRVAVKMEAMLKECLTDPWEYLETKLVTCGQIKASLNDELKRR